MHGEFVKVTLRIPQEWPARGRSESLVMEYAEKARGLAGIHDFRCFMIT